MWILDIAERRLWLTIPTAGLKPSVGARHKKIVGGEWSWAIHEEGFSLEALVSVFVGAARHNACVVVVGQSFAGKDGETLYHHPLWWYPTHGLPRPVGWAFDQDWGTAKEKWQALLAEWRTSPIEIIP